MRWTVLYDHWKWKFFTISKPSANLFRRWIKILYVLKSWLESHICLERNKNVDFLLVNYKMESGGKTKWRALNWDDLSHNRVSGRHALIMQFAHSARHTAPFSLPLSFSISPTSSRLSPPLSHSFPSHCCVLYIFIYLDHLVKTKREIITFVNNKERNNYFF